MVKSNIAAVGDNPVDEFELAGFERDWPIALVQRLHVLVRQLRYHLIEDVVLMDRDHAQAPTGTSKIFGIRVYADRISRELAHQRPEIGDEGSVDVVGQKHQVRAFVLYEVDNLPDRFLVHPHSGGVPRIDDEERLDLGIFELFDFLVGVLKAVLLRRGDLHDLEVIILEVGHLEVGCEYRRAERDRIAWKEQSIGLQRFE